MKFAAFSAALLAGSASAFAPVQQGSRAVTSLNAEMSKSLPFMKRPALVSSRKNKHLVLLLGIQFVFDFINLRYFRELS